MKPNVNVFCLNVILAIFGEYNHWLIIREQGDWAGEEAKILGDKWSKPEFLLGCIGSGNVFAPSHQGGNNLVLPWLAQAIFSKVSVT